jgi:2-polyprenyl-3-methyl-5-hydroxy-6-metoxy-1,4-benzoquinol methylase
VRFEAATAKDIAEQDFDFVTCFDCLHDMGGAAPRTSDAS